MELRKSLVIFTLFAMIISIFMPTPGLVAAAPSDDVMLQDAKAALAIGYANGDSAGRITNNLSLPTLVNGVTVSWVSDKNLVIDSTGVVNRPAFVAGDAVVNLTASLSYGSAAPDSKIFTVMVVRKAPATPEDFVAEVKENLQIGYEDGDSENYVTQKVIINSTGVGSTVDSITWTSSNAAVVLVNGQVVRPATGNETVTLTATITKGAAVDIKTFTLTVIQAVPVRTDAQIVADTKENLQIGYQDGDSSNHITQNIIIDSTRLRNTLDSITWSSNDSSVINIITDSDTGAVNAVLTRPLLGQSIVTLTAVFQKGMVLDTKAFNLTVAGRDTIPPVTTATPAGTVGLDGWYNTSVTVTLNATDATVGDTIVTKYRISDTLGVSGSETIYSGPFTVSGDGTKTVTYWSVDITGNKEVEKTLILKIDTTAPVSSVHLTGITVDSLNYRNAVNITFSSVDISGSGISSIKYSLNGGSLTNIAQGNTLNISAAGNYTLAYYAIDMAGNVELTKTSSFNVLSIPPVPNVTGATYSSTINQITLNWTNPNFGEFKHTLIRRGDGAEQTVTGTTYTDMNLSPNTSYTYKFIVVDQYNVESSGITVNAATLAAPIVDTTPPSDPVNLNITPNGTGFVLTWDTPNDNDLAGFRVYRDGTKIGTVVNATYTDVVTQNGTTYSYKVTAFDNAGNESNGVTKNALSLDLVSPPAPANVQALQVNNSIILTWNAVSAADLKGYNVYVNGSRVNGATVISSTYTVSGLVYGQSYEFGVTSVDFSNNESAKTSVTFILDSNGSSVDPIPTPTPRPNHHNSNTTSNSAVANPPVVEDGVLIITSSDAVTVTQTKKEDGSIVNIITLKEDILKPFVDIKDGFDKIALSLQDLTKASTQIEIPANVLSGLAEKGLGLQLKSDSVSINVNIPTSAVTNGAVATITVDAMKSVAPNSMTANYSSKSNVLEINVNVVDKNGASTLKGVEAVHALEVKLAVAYPNSNDLKRYNVYKEENGTWVPIRSVTRDGAKVFNVSQLNGKFIVMTYDKTFTDVQSHWSKDTVELLASKHIVNGVTDNSFNPNGEVTRAAFISMLIRAINDVNKKETTNQFNDVTQGDWYSAEVSLGVKEGLVKGVSDNSFAPNLAITREQMVVIAVRALNRLDGSKFQAIAETVSLDQRFTDGSKVSDWAKGEVAAAVKSGIVEGNEQKQFNPDALGTRAEAAVMILRILDKSGSY
ncbi:MULTISPECIES: immunoglobulin-like domain-containing protein [unclassified Paenibacillus]|uniref:immunoglobulin-like domain-containing protein n=1 Tax=unclassified Paenibacillus TaxID=185978 RepID=UPI003628F668